MFLQRAWLHLRMIRRCLQRLDGFAEHRPALSRPGTPRLWSGLPLIQASPLRECEWGGRGGGERRREGYGNREEERGWRGFDWSWWCVNAEGKTPFVFDYFFWNVTLLSYVHENKSLFYLIILLHILEFTSIHFCCCYLLFSFIPKWINKTQFEILIPIQKWHKWNKPPRQLSHWIHSCISLKKKFSLSIFLTLSPPFSPATSPAFKLYHSCPPSICSQIILLSKLLLSSCFFLSTTPNCTM